MQFMRFYALSLRLSFFTLIIPTFALPPPNDFVARQAGYDDNCAGYKPATVTVTVTGTPTLGSAINNHHGAYNTYTNSHGSAASAMSHQIPPELNPFFDRNYHAFTYFYDNGFHFTGQKQDANHGQGGWAPWQSTTQLSPSTTKQSYSLSSTLSSSLSTVTYHNITTTHTISTNSSTTTISSSSTSSAANSTASCTPSLRLEGVAENTLNKKSTPFSVQMINCSTFDTSNTTAFANFASIDDMTVTADSISFGGFQEDYVLLSIFALDSLGNAIINSYELHFGSIDMPVQVLGPDDQPASGVLVYGNATIYPGLSQSCVTDESGICHLINLPATTIGLVARTDTNSIAVDGLAATSSQVTLKLASFEAPSGNATMDTDDGLSGWTGGTISQSLRIKRDTTLTVATNAQPDLQTANGKFTVHPFSKVAYVRYKFVTAEVPGGYFGTQFNDYYSVTIRSDTGAFVTVTNSMNAMGLGAFDAAGATDWMMLSLKLPENTKSVDFTIGVSNVADRLLDSSVIVDKAGEAECDQCGDCASCPTDPMCLDKCKNPERGSCDFYRTCAEGQLGCGNAGYPIHYGEGNCNKFKKNLDWFTADGQNWIFDTMLCLQKAMVPVLETCTADCTSFSQAAFDSHPGCYVDSGVCGLTCPDVVALLFTVKEDLFVDPKQVFKTAEGCAENIVETLSGCAGDVLIGVLAGQTQMMLSIAIKYLLSD